MVFVAKHGGGLLLLVCFLLLVSCAPQMPPAENGPSQSLSEPVSSQPAAEQAQGVKEKYLDPFWYFPEEARNALAEQGVTVSVGNGVMVDDWHFTAVLTFSDAFGQTAFPVQVEIIPANGQFRLEWESVFFGEGWFALCDLREMSIIHSGQLDKEPLVLDTSSFGEKDYALLGAAYSSRMGWVVPAVLEGKDMVVFFREDGSLEEAVELFYDDDGYTVFSNAYRVKKNGGELEYRRPPKIFPVPLEEGYVLFSDRNQTQLFSRATGKLYTADAIWGKNGTVTASFHRFDGLFALRSPESGNDGLCIWEEEGAEPVCFFTGAIKGIHPMFSYSEELTWDWEPDRRRVTLFGDYTRVQITMDFDRKRVELEHLLRLEDLDPEDLENPDRRSPDGRYILAAASPDGGGDVLYWTNALYDTQTGRIRFVVNSGGMYGGGPYVSFLDENRLWVHDFDGVQLYNTHSLEPLPLPFPLELGENELLLGLGYDREVGQYAILYGTYTDFQSGFYYGRDSTDTYRLAVYDADGNRLADFDTGIPFQSSLGGLLRFSLTVEDGAVSIPWTICEYDREDRYSCRILFETQTVEKTAAG